MFTTVTQYAESLVDPAGVKDMSWVVGDMISMKAVSS